METNIVCEIKEASWSCLKTALLCPGYRAERWRRMAGHE